MDGLRRGIVALWLVYLLQACGPGQGARHAGRADFYPEEVLSPAERRKEIDEKTARVADYLLRIGKSAASLESVAFQAWFSGGLLPLASVPARVFPRRILVTADGRRFVGDDSIVQGARLRPVLDLLGIDSGVAEGGRAGEPAVADGSGETVVDPPPLLYPLTESEIRKYRWLGRRSAEVLEGVCRELAPFATEEGIAVLVSNALRERAIEPVRVLVSSDDRVPEAGLSAPAEKQKVEKFAVIGVTARRWGIHVTLARSVSLEPLSEATRRDLNAAAGINATLWARVVPGGPLDEAYQAAVAAYTTAGIGLPATMDAPGWATGYEEVRPLYPGTPNAVLSPGIPTVWQVSARRVTLMDTVLLVGDTFELLTGTHDWPRIEAKAEGRIYRIPSILAR
jgi:hypothetical protein